MPSAEQHPAGEQISVTMAIRLADMHEIAPQLTQAVAKRITSTDLHDKALQDLGAFVRRTVVDDEHRHTVRIDGGAVLDAAEQIAHAREHLGAEEQRQIWIIDPAFMVAVVHEQLVVLNRCPSQRECAALPLRGTKRRSGSRTST